MKPCTMTAVLLVGGNSTRMGTDKATLDWYGRPLWKVGLDTLSELQPEALGVSAQARPSWLNQDLSLFLDEHPGAGPLRALNTILRSMQTTHALVLAVDMPAMSSPFLRELALQAEIGMGVVPEVNDRFEVLAAVYPREALDLFPDPLNLPDPSLQWLLQTMNDRSQVWVRKTSRTEAPLFRNLNYPADVAVSTTA